MEFEFQGKTVIVCTEHPDIPKVGCPVCSAFMTYNRALTQFKLTREDIHRRLIDFLRTKQATITNIR